MKHSDSGAVKLRLIVAFLIFVAGCSFLSYSKNRAERKKLEVYELKGAVYDTIEHYVSQKGGKNIMVLDVSERTRGSDKAVFSTKYKFETALKGGETTTTQIETDLVLAKASDGWKVQKLVNLRQHIAYVAGSFVKKKNRMPNSIR